MNLTIRHLEYLASRHDCVIVPGLGAVLARMLPAEEDDCGRWTAPSRSYSFNGALTVSDGLMVGSVARSMKVSHERAMDIVADEVAAMRRQLDRERSLSLGRVGQLMFDDEANLIFESAASDTLSPFAGWYPVYSRKQSAIETPIINNVSSRIRITPFGRFIRVAAAIVVLVAVALAVSTPVSVKDAQYAALGLPAPSMPRTENVQKAQNDRRADMDKVNAQSPAKADELPAISDGSNLEAKIADNPVVGIKTEKKAKAKAYSYPRLNDFDSYCLVVASLVSEEAAERFIRDEARRNPHLALAVLEQNGRYRVYAATGRTEAQALDAAKNPQISRYKGVWVTRR